MWRNSFCAENLVRRTRRSLSYRCIGYLLCVIVALFLIQQAAAQDNVQALAVDEIGRIPPQHQQANNVKAKQVNGNNNVKGIPVSVSFPRGDYQW